MYDSPEIQSVTSHIRTKPKPKSKGSNQPKTIDFLAQAMFLARRARAKQYTKIGYGANEDHPDLEVGYFSD